LNIARMVMKNKRLRMKSRQLLGTREFLARRRETFAWRARQGVGVHDIARVPSAA